MKSKKIFAIMIILICILLFANTSVQAVALSEAFNSADGFINSGKSSIINYSNMYDIISYLYNIVMLIAIVISIIVGIVLGIRIIFGSVDERADAKHLIVPYLIIVAMAAFGLGIWKAVLSILYNKI